MNPQALYIGPRKVNDALAKMRPDLEFKEPVENINQLWKGLESGAIDPVVHIIFILDNFFDPAGQKTAFEDFVATMAPHCIVCILNYRPTYVEAIRERIQYKLPDGHYYFVNPKHPHPDIDGAIADFVRVSDQQDIIDVFSDDVKPEIQKKEEPAPVAVNDENEFAEEDNPYLGQLVVVTSSKGGSGKSAIAVSLASFLAHASTASAKKNVEDRALKVLILDLDIRDGQLGFLTGNTSPTMLNLRAKDINMKTVEETVIESSRLRCDLMLAPKRPRNADDIPPEFFVELVGYLRKMYDYIIMDTSVNYLDPLLEKVAYPMADQIIFVCDVVVQSVFSMTRWIQEVTQPQENGGMGISRKKIGIVVNKAKGDVNMPAEKIKTASLNIPILTSVPDAGKLFAHSANMQSMEVVLRNKDVYKAIRRLARSVVVRRYRLTDFVDNT